jgi:hypothetical protein
MILASRESKVRGLGMVIFSPQTIEVEQKSQEVKRILQCGPGHFHDQAS